jgi:hypothetical protein
VDNASNVFCQGIASSLLGALAFNRLDDPFTTRVAHPQQPALGTPQSDIGWNSVPTAKMRRARREQTMKRTREEIEPIAALVADAMLKVHRALGPGLREFDARTASSAWSTGYERAH